MSVYIKTQIAKIKAVLPQGKAKEENDTIDAGIALLEGALINLSEISESLASIATSLHDLANAAEHIRFK